MCEPDDKLLVTRAARGDQDAFGALADRHRDAIYSFAVRMLGDGEEAFDAAQDILIRAYTGLATFDPSRAFRPWLFAIAANVCTDLLRRRGRRVDALDDGLAAEAPADENASPPRVAAKMELQRRVTAALQHLSAPERMVVALKHIQGFTYEEISDMTAMPVGTLKSHAHRGRQRLAELLEPTAVGSVQ